MSHLLSIEKILRLLTLSIFTIQSALWSQTYTKTTGTLSILHNDHTQNQLHTKMISSTTRRLTNHHTIPNNYNNPTDRVLTPPLTNNSTLEYIGYPILPPPPQPRLHRHPSTRNNSNNGHPDPKFHTPPTHKTPKFNINTAPTTNIPTYPPK
eukprot:scaffold164735_cov25-Attheya_sp.AAC.1